MNKGFIVAAFATLMVTTASFDAVAQDAALEAQLKELAKSPPDIATAGKWFKLKDSVTDNGLRQEILKASAAALILSKKSDVYQARVRPLLDDAEGFEESFLAPCSECGGDGTASKVCPVCKGSGDCQYMNCQGGRHRIHQINGDRYENCRECKGSGQCQKCKGKGNLDGKCPRCGGKGKSMDRNMLSSAYKKHTDTAARWEQVKRERIERERQEAEVKARAKAERVAQEQKREERRRERDVDARRRKVTHETETPRRHFPSKDWSTTDSRNGAFPIPFSSGSTSFQTVFVGALNAGGDPQYDIYYSGEPAKRLIIRMDDDGDGLSERWGRIPFLVVTEKGITKFHEAWEMADSLSEVISESIHKVPNPKPFAGNEMKLQFPQCFVWYVSPKGEADPDRMSICETVKLAFRTVESPQSRFSDGFENEYYLVTSVRRSTASGQQSWWRDPPYETGFTIQFHPEMKGGEPLSKFVEITNPAYLERCWRNRDIANGDRQEKTKKTVETSAGKEETTPHRPHLNQEAESVYEEAMRYFEGDGVLKNLNKALRLLQEASEKGSANANGKLALYYFMGLPDDGKNVKKAVEYAEKSGSQKTDLAKMVLGNCYLYGGDGVKSDYSKAYSYFSQSTDYNYSKFMRGLMQYHGVGTKEDKENAAESFFDCCKGMKEGQYCGEAAICLGYMYANGIGIGKDSLEARKWLTWGVKAAGYYLDSYRPVYDFLYEKIGMKVGNLNFAKYPANMELVRSGLVCYYADYYGK